MRKNILLVCFVLLSIATVLSYKGKEKEEVVEKSFIVQREFDEIKFTDYNKTSWYAENVSKAFSYGFLNGKTESTMVPNGKLSIAEAITIAARIHSTYYEKEITHYEGRWYDKYVSYALYEGIMSSENLKVEDYSRKATREEVAYIFNNIFEDEKYVKVKQIESFPEMDETGSFKKDVLNMMNSGIITGYDENNTFKPKNNINRAEIATIVVRLINMIND